MWPQDVAASRAHARMLGARGIIPAGDAAAIDEGLARIAAELADGSFAFAAGRRGHPHRRRAAPHRAGRRRRAGACTRPAAATTRSSPTPCCTCGRPPRPRWPGCARWPRRCSPRPRPTSTRSCPATPTASGPSRCASRTTCSPTSGCSTATAPGWATRSPRPPTARSARARSRASASRSTARPTAAELGFARPSPNSLDAVGSRDALVDYLHFAAQLGVHLSRLGAEIVLWAGEEAGFVELDDAFTSGSSMLPQKKNPDAAELARGKAPRLIADLSGLLGRHVRPAAGLQQGHAGGQGVPLRRRSTRSTCCCRRWPGMVAGARFRADRMARRRLGRLPGRDRPGRPPGHARVALPPGPRGRRAAGAGVPRARASA